MKKEWKKNHLQVEHLWRLYMLPSNYVKRGGSESVTIYGAVFNNDLEVVHSKATTIAECEKFHGSKYVLSSMGQNYKEVEIDLLSGKCVLFSGTPCQVAAIKSFLNKKHIPLENFYTIDIICHGAPGKKLWADYREWIQKKNRSSLSEFSFRYKKARWKLYPCMARFENGKMKINTQDVRVYTTLFFTHLAYRECCYSCKYADIQREGDITLGDFWGFENVMPTVSARWKIKAEDGVSLVLVNSSKGKTLWDLVLSNQERCLIEECTSGEFIKYQHNLVSPTEKPKRIEEFREDYKNHDFNYIAQKYAHYDLKGKIRFILSRIYHEWFQL